MIGLNQKLCVDKRREGYDVLSLMIFNIDLAVWPFCCASSCAACDLLHYDTLMLYEVLIHSNIEHCCVPYVSCCTTRRIS